MKTIIQQIKQGVSVILIFSIFCVLLIIFLSFFREKKTTDGKIKAIATLVGSRKSHNEEGEYKYFANGKVMSDYGLCFYSQVYGDKFLLYYDEENPSEPDIHYDKPVFTKDEVLKFSVGTISITFLYKYIRFIHFTYSINGIEYDRIQYLSDDFEEKYPNLETGQEYQIRYLVENPQRSIIYFDMPVEEYGFRIVE
ncbi:hypothetical protein ACE193_11435 [Bernardetia sp. OM2101]|uniref:hypothetical protein n=1 Tax=Bernardetia sp. OM2101 TaxID=3344876 RepID=UPI0035D01505